MNVTVTATPLAELEVDLLLVLATKEDSAAALADELGSSFQRAASDFDGTLETSLLFYPDAAQADRAALLGLGNADALDPERLRRTAAQGATLAWEHNARTVGLVMPALDEEAEAASQALTEGFLLGAYRFLRYKTDDEAFAGPEQLTLHSGRLHDADAACRRGTQRTQVVADAVATARDLVNRSPDEKTATDLARLIEASGQAHGYETTVWDKERIADEQMGGLLAVNRGSVEPPTFTVMEWKPEQAVNERPLVLVGKSVVFDTGGLSLKPTKKSMDYMKADMAGGAAVIGAFEAAAQLELPVHLVGLIPATDNRPGENAYVPGDVIRMHDGTTVEVLNTDAEGRLTLADALSYAKQYEPELVIDLATLTGASVVALGTEAAAVMTADTDGASERLDAMQAAGARSGDRVHPLPMFAEYDQLLESDVADRKNIGGKEAGAITAAKFLEHFVAYPWLHLDIAGPAFLHEAKPYRPKGGTGFGVRLLIAFLRAYAESVKRKR